LAAEEGTIPGIANYLNTLVVKECLPSLPDDLGKLCASWPTHFEKNPVVTHQLFELYRLPNPENAPRKLSPEILEAPPTSPIIPLPTCNW